MKYTALNQITVPISYNNNYYTTIALIIESVLQVQLSLILKTCQITLGYIMPTSSDTYVCSYLEFVCSCSLRFSFGQDLIEYK